MDKDRRTIEPNSIQFSALTDGLGFHQVDQHNEHPTPHIAKPLRHGTGAVSAGPPMPVLTIEEPLPSSSLAPFERRAGGFFFYQRIMAYFMDSMISGILFFGTVQDGAQVYYTNVYQQNHSAQLFQFFS